MNVLRAELMTVALALLERGSEVLSLDEIAEALGTLRVSAEDIDQLFAWLEAEGRVVGEAPGAGAATTLQQVLAIARALRQELGRAPHPREIAERSSLSVAEVQRALLFARILQR